MPLDPAAKQAMRLARRLAGRAQRAPEGWRHRARTVDDVLAARFMTPAPEVRITDIEVPVPGQTPVRVRLTRPLTRHHETPLPLLLSFFGGAFRQGGIDFATFDNITRARAVGADLAIAAVDYALAPEHRYPTPVDQGLAALGYLHDHAHELALDPARMAIGGMSSGGGIAAAVALRNRDELGIPLRLQLLEVPALDLTGAHLTMRIAWRLGIPAPLAKHALVGVALDYLGDRRHAAEPYASPLLAPNLAGLPPARILTAQYDILRGDGEAYAHALNAAGTKAIHTRYPGQTHDSSFYTAASQAAQQWQRDVATALRGLRTPTDN